MSGEPAGAAELEGLPGVRALEHTADVGLEVEAPDPPALFHRCALGMRALVEGGGAPRPGSQAGLETRFLELSAPDLPRLLAAWLRELLFLHEVKGFGYRSASFQTLDPPLLRARVEGDAAARVPDREIKGVTYHGLEAGPNREREGGDGGRKDAPWRARVIFDV